LPGSGTEKSPSRTKNSWARQKFTITDDYVGAAYAQSPLPAAERCAPLISINSLFAEIDYASRVTRLRRVVDSFFLSIDWTTVAMVIGVLTSVIAAVVLPTTRWTLMPNRRFPRPWCVEDVGGSFVVKASNDRPLIFIYYRDGVGRRSLAKLLTRNAARRIAANIAKLPELLREP
jgi:hypothetical protein